MRLVPRVLIVLPVLGYPAVATAIGSPTDAGSSQWKREDIIVFREQFLAADRSFTPEARATAEARLSHLERVSESTSPSEFIVELCRIAALADNGHTQCLPTWLGRDICRQVTAIFGTKSPACQNPDRQVPHYRKPPCLRSLSSAKRRPRPRIRRVLRMRSPLCIGPSAIPVKHS
jgi:hypothetical protein